MEKSRREYSGQGGNEGRPWTHLPQAPKLQQSTQQLSMKASWSLVGTGFSQLKILRRNHEMGKRGEEDSKVKTHTLKQVIRKWEDYHDHRGFSQWARGLSPTSALEVNDLVPARQAPRNVWIWRPEASRGLYRGEQDRCRKQTPS